jgi:hypothetical protein
LDSFQEIKNIIQEKEDEFVKCSENYIVEHFKILEDYSEINDENLKQMQFLSNSLEKHLNSCSDLAIVDYYEKNIKWLNSSVSESTVDKLKQTLKELNRIEYHKLNSMISANLNNLQNLISDLSPNHFFPHNTFQFTFNSEHNLCELIENDGENSHSTRRTMESKSYKSSNNNKSVESLQNEEKENIARVYMTEKPSQNCDNIKKKKNRPSIFEYAYRNKSPIIIS